MEELVGLWFQTLSGGHLKAPLVPSRGEEAELHFCEILISANLQRWSSSGVLNAQTGVSALF